MGRKQQQQHCSVYNMCTLWKVDLFTLIYRMLRVVVYDKKVMLWLISPLKKAFFPHFYFVWLLSLEVNQYVPILALLHRFPAEVKCCAASVMRGETLQEQGEIRRFTIRREREKKKKQSKLKLHFCWSKRFFFHWCFSIVWWKM